MIVEILKRLDFFSELSPNELSKLSSIADEVAFKAGEKIVEEGKYCASLFIVKEGCVRVKKGEALDVLLGEGNPVGELSFIDKELPSATVIAEQNSTLIRIPSEAFEYLIKEDKGIASALYKSFALTLCRKLRDTNDWLLTRQWLSEIEKEVRGRIHL